MTARAVLDGIKAELAAATPGPWEFDGDEIHNAPDYAADNPAPWTVVMDCEVSCGSYCYGGSVRQNISEGDRAFIASAPATVARLSAAVESVLALHSPDTYGECRQCADGPGYFHPYPCPTASAIENALTKEGQ